MPFFHSPRVAGEARVKYDDLVIAHGPTLNLRGSAMSEDWQRCPHCALYFVPSQTCEPAAVCPSCGMAVAAQSETTASSKWYFARDKEKIGPASLAQMKQLVETGKLAPTDMVLQSGAPKWTAAGDVKEFFPKSILPPTETTKSVPLTYKPDRTGFASRHDILSEAQVVPEAANCVQCGMCSYNCPMEIDVRAHAWRGIPIRDSHCLTCSECVNRCPRGVLRFERISLFIKT